jgi:polyisoprenoid-binding protein YceI
MAQTQVSSRERELPIGTWRSRRGSGHIGFEAKTMWGLGTVRGGFNAYDGTLRVGLDGCSAELRIDSASIDTGNAVHDRRLRSADFLDTERHPSLSFRSETISWMPGGLLIAGELMIRTTAVPLQLPVDVSRSRSGLYVLRTRAIVSRELANLAWNWLGMIRGDAIVTVELHLVPELNGLADRR